jgi:hypothetical protein
MLRPDAANGPRPLVSCSRCGFLRYLTDAPPASTCSFSTFFQKRVVGGNLAGYLLEALRSMVATGPVRFVAQRATKGKARERILVADAIDGTLPHAFERQGPQCVALSSSLAGALHAAHREGVDSAVSDSSSMPLLRGSVDTIVRLRGFASEEDPAGWLARTSRQIAPGGRIVVQVFDCASWAFLLSGSKWVGLSPDEARYAFRAEDLEVLVDLCGLRVVRRSHFFPLLNACAWASSIFPSLNVIRPGWSTRQRPPLGRVVAYLLCVVAMLPLATAESLCHAGSVMLIEAEPKQ